ncbi:peroxisome assembly protein 12-like [Ruditapes philippinarum]|uniref:peroxisome assembly protein 12-like n=1 Tax=Ruditapes philippinarum TaxID=129788 RepID=UPI00295B534C|nr:peroxisome assembly protein 12-like [Ruditapes philippinarum]
MAEGAHLTSAVGHERPSVFEVLAQESLISTVRPAIKHAVRVAAENRPERFGWLLQHYDEVYTALNFLLEQYYLRKYCATFAENFYSLKRVYGDTPSSSRLPRGVVWKSLFYVVILPYIKQKMDEKFEDLRHVYNTYAGNQEMSRLSKTFVAVYPYVHTVWEGAVLSYQTAYMFGKCDWHSPFLHLTGVTLCNDLEEGDSISSRSTPWQQLSLQEKLVLVVKKLLNFTAVSVSTSLSVGLFFIQFLDWWYTSETSHKSLTSLPVPDPPERDSSSEATQFNICPICHRTRSNDTALSVSGYVFCYPCIYDYVKEYKKCPVTKFPAQTEHLIKLYITAP